MDIIYHFMITLATRGVQQSTYTPCATFYYSQLPTFNTACMHFMCASASLVPRPTHRTRFMCGPGYEATLVPTDFNTACMQNEIL